MEVKIYVDVLFIINFIIDYILLSVTAFFIKKTPKTPRICLGSLAGAVYASCVFFMPFGTFLLLIFSLISAVAMIAISFGIKKVSALLKNTATFCLISAVTAGVGFSFVFTGNTGHNYAINNGIFYADINAYTMLFIFIFSVIIIHSATGFIKKQKTKSRFLYNVTIEKNGRSICDTALFDSGNFLRDPITQKSVIVAEWQSVAPLFDEHKVTETIVAHPEDFVYIACHGIENTSGMYAFTADKVFSDETDFPEPVFVAITQTPLDIDGTYRMLLPNTTQLKKGYNNGLHF